MKNLLLLALILSFSNLLAQIQVDRNDFGDIGDTILLQRDLTFLDSITPGPSGPNQVWDFSGLSIDSVPDTLLFLDPSVFPQSANLDPSINLVIKDGNSLLFLEAVPMGIFGHALTLDFDTFFNNTLLEANPKLEVYTLPMFYGFDYTGNYSANSITFAIKDTVSLGGFTSYVDSVRISPNLEKADSIEAHGQLILPGNKTYDVLRQKSVLTISVSIEALIPNFLPIPPPLIWFPLPAGIVPDIVTTTYSYIAKNEKYPVLELNTDSLGDVISARFQYDTTSIDSTLALSYPFEDLKVYPNPTLRVLNIDLEDREAYFKILDPIGKVHLEGILRNRKNRLDISTLPPGMYLLQIESLELKGNTQIRILKY